MDRRTTTSAPPSTDEALSVRSSTRRRAATDGDARSQRPGPSTERGRRTQITLVHAARAVFERDGYLNARVTDITAQADVAVGTFYTYFRSKEEIFQAVVGDIGNEIYALGVSTLPEDDPVGIIGQANRQFLHFYRRNVDLMAIIEQVATINPDFRETRRQLRDRMVSRVEGSIARLQANGTADPLVDAHCAASALVSMVSNFAYTWMVLGEPFDHELAVETLTRLWAQSLGIPVGVSTTGAR